MSKTGKTMRFRRTLLSILLSTALAVTMFPGFGIMSADAFATE